MDTKKSIHFALAAAWLLTLSSIKLHAAGCGVPAIGVVPFVGKANTNESAIDKNMYVVIDGGAAFQQNVTLTESQLGSGKVSYNTGPRLDMQIGLNLCTNWAAEFEMGLIISPVSDSWNTDSSFNNTALLQAPLLLNLVYKRPLGNGWSAYVGAGGGAVLNQYENIFGATTPVRAAAAYQGMAGIKYAFNKDWEIGLGYKILGTTDYDVESGVRSTGNLCQSVLLTFTGHFGR
jgi:opacity protein-like surface antigen